MECGFLIPENVVVTVGGAVNTSCSLNPAINPDAQLWARPRQPNILGKNPTIFVLQPATTAKPSIIAVPLNKGPGLAVPVPIPILITTTTVSTTTTTVMTTVMSDELAQQF